ncbi:DUF6055 domain-containing protein [Maribellus mangrovi]|uniref:DUF6055 domain-containing protein n=1 Tax=Maribellus mangrovi TaxID=3133146 RepID=UPI0030ED2C49
MKFIDSYLKPLVFLTGILMSWATANSQAILKHSYTFEDGTAKDVVGNADATVVGGAISNGAYTSASQGDYVKLPAGTIAINTYHSFTMEAYIRPVSGANNGFTMFCFFGDALFNGSWGKDYFSMSAARTDDVSRVAISCGNSSAPWSAETGVNSTEYDDGKLHYLVATVDDTSISFYIDGKFAGSENLSGNNKISSISNTAAYLCKSGYTDPTWIGSIEEFNIYDGLLNADTITTRGNETLLNALSHYNLDSASATNPVALTELITNPGFESSFTGWTNIGMATQSNNVFPIKEGGIFAEKWVNRGSKVPDVSVQQILNGIPNGNYVLKAAAGNIQQTGSGSTVNLGNPQTGAELFAGYRKTNVNTIKDYSINITVIDNQLNFGFKTLNASGNWVTCDNFRLYYTGRYSVNDYASYVNDIVKESITLLNQNFSSSVKDNLDSVINEVQQILTAQPLDMEDIKTAQSLLDEAVQQARNSLQRYEDLQSMIDYANKVMQWYSEDQSKTSTLQEAIDIANQAENNYDLTINELNAETTNLTTVVNSIDKRKYIPAWMMGNVNDPENNWSYKRSKQSKNWILFWEPGFGDKPVSIVDECLDLAEKCFDYYADSLKFITKGASKSDNYKMIIRLRYTSEWEASGSGVDDTIGLLTLTSWALSSRGGQTIAHEVGHCFQYQVHCDNNDANGWMYGFGANASGGNGWWEQCAQWQAYKIFPAMQFNNEWFSGYMDNVHKNILHESPRYNNFFLQDYWTDLHGKDFIGRLWNESRRPEDPVEAYKRLTGISQKEFNDEMYYCGAKFASWDIPSLKAYGKNHVSSRPQPQMKDAGDNYWLIDQSACPENYGHNIIKLNAPASAKIITAEFEGKAGMNGYNKINTSHGGWRFGFVALKYDGSTVYSEIKSAGMTVNEGKGNIRFECPENCSKLWFVVTGAPDVHWRHEWDDDATDDEQWPYQVRFGNTNLLGYPNIITDFAEIPEDIIRVYSGEKRLFIKNLKDMAEIHVYNLSGQCVFQQKVNSPSFSTTIPSGVYIVTIRTEKGRNSHKIIIR